jgi:hypothetical protein
VLHCDCAWGVSCSGLQGALECLASHPSYRSHVSCRTLVFCIGTTSHTPRKGVTHSHTITVHQPRCVVWLLPCVPMLLSTRTRRLPCLDRLCDCVWAWAQRAVGQVEVAVQVELWVTLLYSQRRANRARALLHLSRFVVFKCPFHSHPPPCPLAHSHHTLHVPRTDLGHFGKGWRRIGRTVVGCLRSLLLRTLHEIPG